MTAPAPKKSSHKGKIIVAAVALFMVGLVGFGYLSQTAEMRTSDAANAATVAAAAPQATFVPLPADDALFAVKPEELVIGKADAPVTIIEYSSLSCPHCAHFHSDILPGITKALLDTGKAKLVFRHFPLNEPALRAAQLVECAGGDRRMPFLTVLFDLQKSWAFSETFKTDLKLIAAQGGVDSAAYDSCLADAEGENAILAVRQMAATRAGVDSTPSFFVNGVALADPSTVESFISAVDAATKPANP